MGMLVAKDDESVLVVGWDKGSGDRVYCRGVM
jgi:hypothetical protein